MSEITYTVCKVCHKSSDKQYIFDCSTFNPPLRVGTVVVCNTMFGPVEGIVMTPAYNLTAEALIFSGAYRRRECLTCGRQITTFEREKLAVDLNTPTKEAIKQASRAAKKIASAFQDAVARQIKQE